MDPTPHYDNDLNSAMAYKGQHPEYIMVVSLEDESMNFDDFWSNQSVLSILRSNFIITRLSQVNNSAGFQQFTIFFQISEFPTIVIFGEQSAKVSKVMYPYPDVDTFCDYFLPPKLRSKNKAKNSAPQAERTTTKISVQSITGHFSKVFNVDETIGDLKKWILEESGDDNDLLNRLIVSHTHNPLPSDDSMTLKQADLVPSALLKAVGDEQFEIHVEDGSNEMPMINGRSPSRNRTGFCTRLSNFKLFKVIKNIGDMINPWGDDGTDDSNPNFWQFQPNPQMSRDIREMMRLARQQPRFAEA